MHNNRSRTVRYNKTLITAQKKKKRQTCKIKTLLTTFHETWQIVDERNSVPHHAEKHGSASATWHINMYCFTLLVFWAVFSVYKTIFLWIMQLALISDMNIDPRNFCCRPWAGLWLAIAGLWLAVSDVDNGVHVSICMLTIKRVAD